VTASVIVPLFNRYDLTCQLLESLTVDPDFELVLVDNGSTDQTRLMDVAVRNNINRGFAVACNQGARYSSGDVLIFLNNDTIVSVDWLPPLREALVDADIAGPKLVYPDGEPQSFGISVDFSRPPGLEAVNLRTDLNIGSYEVAAVTGACLAIRRGLFERLGGFDEGFWNGYEDVDLCLRAKAVGARIVFEPRSVVTHLESQSDRRERFAKVSENVARLRSKHCGVTA